MDMDRPYFAIEKVRTNLTYGHLRNYDGSRCSRFWPFGNPPSLQYGAMAGQGRAAKRSLSRRSLWRRRIGTGAQRCRWPKDAQPIRAAAVGTSGGVASLVTAHGWGCSSLASCHMSQLPFAQPIVVSGCALILNFTPLTL